MAILNHTNTCDDPNSIKDGDLLVIQLKKTKKNIVVKCQKVLNRNTGHEEILIEEEGNLYFIWSMYKSGSSWVWRVWNLGDVEITSITNNSNDIKDY